MKSSDILLAEKKKSDYKVSHVPNLIVSFFTIVFAISIVFEIRDIIGEFIFLVLSLFLGTFLIFNEYLKVNELKHYFKRNGKGNLAILIITFSLSVGLSVIGVYFWVDKTYKSDVNNKLVEINQTDSLNTVLMRNVEKLDVKYDLTLNSQYKQEYSNLEFNKKELRFVWKKQDREPILNKIETIENNIRLIQNDLEKKKQNEIKALNNKHKATIESLTSLKGLNESTTNKNKFICYVIILLTLLNDFVAIMFAKMTATKELLKETFLSSDKVKEFLEYRQAVKTLLSENKPKTSFHINEIMGMSGLEYDKAKHLLFTVLSATKIVKIAKKSTITILMKKDEGLKALEDYYDNYFNV